MQRRGEGGEGTADLRVACAAPAAPAPMRGMTLMELVVVLAITGILTGLALPRLVGGADRWIVREAREELVGLLYQARVEARRYGGATLEVETGGGALVRRSDGEVIRRWEPTTPGVELEVAGSRDRAELDFGPAGLGRVANATLKVRRGREEVEVIVSSYGRVRR